MSAVEAANEACQLAFACFVAAPQPKRYPLEPLARLVGASSYTSLARELGVSGSMLSVYRTKGLTDAAADRLAVRAGWHPAEVWPEWFDDALLGG